MLRRLACLVAAGFSLAFLPACGGGGGKAQTINRIEQVPVALTIDMKGDLNVSLKQTVLSHFIVRQKAHPSGDERDTQVVGTEPVEPLSLGAARFLAGVGVVPYNGDGKYTLPAGSPLEELQKAKAAGTTPKQSSSIKVDWWPTGQIQADPETFMRRVKPCTVIVKDKGTRGTLTCPDVSNEAKDKHFSLTLTWVAPTTPAPTTTTTTAAGS